MIEFPIEWPDGEPAPEVHDFRVTKTKQIGINTGRPRWHVECRTCKELIHEATTGPGSLIGYHLIDSVRKTG